MFCKLRVPFTIGMLLLAGVGDAGVADAQDLVASLRARDPLTRASAFEQLRQRPGAFASPGMHNALLELAERESALIAQTLRESHGRSGIEDAYGQRFADYVSDVAEECALHCDLTNPRAVFVLAESFPGETDVAVKLAADHGPLLLPVFLRKSAIGLGDERRNAVVMLGNIAGESRALSDRETAAADSALLACASSCPSILVPEAVRAIGFVAVRNNVLSAKRRSAFHRAVVNATASRDEAVRFVAVDALVSFRDTSDLSLLETIRLRDTKSVATLAAKASARIREP